MRAYDVALFIHLLGVITLFLALGIVQRAGIRLRAAATVEHARLWLELLRTSGPMFPSAAVLLLVTGLYMTAGSWSFSTPWVAVSLAGLVVLALQGGLVQGTRLRAMGVAAAAAADGPVPPELARLIADPVPWVSLGATNGAALGILWLMATKPGLVVSVAVVVGLWVLGALVGLAVLRRTATGRAQPAA